MQKTILAATVIIAAVAVFLLFRFLLSRKGLPGKTYIVGETITDQEITEFFYTYDRMDGDALYQRYHFYIKEGEYCFFYETRESIGPGMLTEEDSTRTGTIVLTKEEWQDFLDHIRGGSVRKRQESTVSGDPGPWEYLYWNGDKGKYQEYSFPDADAEAAFEGVCEQLRDKGGADCSTRNISRVAKAVTLT